MFPPDENVTELSNEPFHADLQLTPEQSFSAKEQLPMCPTFEIYGDPPLLFFPPIPSKDEPFVPAGPAEARCHVYGAGVGVLNTIPVVDQARAVFLSRQYTYLPLHDHHFIRIAAGGNYFAGLTIDGKILTAGEISSTADEQDRLGRPCADLGTAASTSVQLRMVPGEVEPVIPSGAPPVRFIQVACGDTFTVALSAQHQIYFWGHFVANDKPVVGQDAGFFTRPQLYPGIHDKLQFRAIAAGLHFVVAQTMRGEVVTFGSNETWALGRPSSEMEDTTKENASVPGYVVDQERKALHGVSIIGAGFHHAFAYSRATDQLWAWGGNLHRQTGTCETTDYVLEACVVPRFWPPNTHLVSITGGRNHSLALTNTGRVYYFGSAIGCLSGMPREHVDQLRNDQLWLAPVDIGLENVSKVVCGIDHNMAITQPASTNPAKHIPKRTVVAWGGNNYFELGLGHCDAQETPVALVESYSVQDIAIGGRQSFILGHVYTSVPEKPFPVQICNQDFVDFFNCDTQPVPRQILSLTAPRKYKPIMSMTKKLPQNTDASDASFVYASTTHSADATGSSEHSSDTITGNQNDANASQAQL
ncbi:regulator of chromosome condensation 1/beta-lactamase-inhibitor protein II [Gongronella butleri]|nr:regulator of chromosome condensation 1/beta-lactamase-inhibitor protein II [Gongronella butleri]